VANYVDFQHVKATISIVQVLDMLGIKHLKPHGQALRGICPICQIGNDRTFVVTPAKSSFFCFSEKTGGDIIELVARVNRIPQKEAAQRIAQHFRQTRTDAALPSLGATKPPPDAHPTGFDPKAYQASLDPAHAALKDCGVQEQTIRDFDGGYCTRGLNRGRLVLPIHDGGGTILAFMGLALNGEQPNILFPKAFEPPSFFNLHRVGPGVLYLVQSPGDVLRAWEAKLFDVICPLAPLTPDVLDSLAASMRERGCETLETY
jgi:CHC2-type zinc finger protein